MQRELKFRVYRGGVMYNNIGLHPYICCSHTKQDPEDSFYINPETTADGHLTLWNNDEGIMQFTGLKDKGGVDIYEGDIVRCGDIIVSVSWHDGAFHIMTNDHQGANTFVQDRAKRFEVIGNIYQNPELL